MGLIAASLVLVLSEEIEEYDYEDDGGAAPPPPPPPQHVGRGRIPLPSSRQNKGPALIGNANKINGKPGAGGKGAPPAKSTAAPPVQEPQEEEIDEYDEGVEEPVEQTSTEAPKKTIKPIVRPFRSNDDLLAALKRRRQQAQNSGSVVDKTNSSPSTSTTTAPPSNKKSSNSFGRNRNGGGGRGGQQQQQPQDEYVEPESPKKGSQSRNKYNTKNGSRSPPAPVLEDIPVEEQAKPKFGRGSRRS
ncbi:conserved hypothetical protein [Pediculus humanus corporis]|uniref:Uncharacterized protein n=1 Tax=Pediculus humanus subsp. corporis TaxID=121224 RepID=E0VXT6_PEDHC|nr:uncharacterized protein Phum_PHUM504280 [Pediculus humanus corporis]EEB18192.1 conserved hypothetical protein [Pediculus humanus corporis]